jgi:pentose-5-phosphate-3-epimerase
MSLTLSYHDSKPWYKDQGFIGSSIDKIKNCRKLLDSYCSRKRPGRFIDIFADGAIDHHNYKALIHAGASVLVLESVF